MKSDYFEKIQKRYDELAKEGYRLTTEMKFYESLLKELPSVPDDTYCTHGYMFRIHENIYKDKSSKTLLYRLYNDETFEWSEWRENDFNTIDDMTRAVLSSSPSVYWKDKEGVEFVDFMSDVVLKDKKIYLLNMASSSEKSYAPNIQLVLYAPELLQKKYVRKSDNKEIGGDIFPWLFIYVGLPSLRYSDTPVGAEIFSLHTYETKEEAKHSFAMRLVNGFPGVYRDKKGTNLYKKNIEDVEASLEKGVLPEGIVDSPIHINYNYVMFRPAQGIQRAQERMGEVEERLDEINPEFLRLKAILSMSPSEKKKFIEEEEKKEAEAAKRKKEEAKQKAAERAAQREADEAIQKKENKIMYIGFAVFFITAILCYIPTTFIRTDLGAIIVDAVIITIVVIVWKAIKKRLKRKWGIKDEE